MPCICFIRSSSAACVTLSHQWLVITDRNVEAQTQRGKNNTPQRTLRLHASHRSSACFIPVDQRQFGQTDKMSNRAWTYASFSASSLSNAATAGSLFLKRTSIPFQPSLNRKSIAVFGAKSTIICQRSENPSCSGGSWRTHHVLPKFSYRSLTKKKGQDKG